MSINLAEFQSQLKSYKCKYPCSETDPYDFDEFWRWKLRIESGNGQVLDESNRDEAHKKLSKALLKWRAYRPSKSAECLKTLRTSLANISDAYDRIRNYTLLEFDKVPIEPLKLIWNELGRTKEKNGKINDQDYYIVSISKPLIFLWGQTLAFDSIVRSNIPKFGIYSYIINDTRWNFETWKEVMEKFEGNLRKQPEAIDTFEKEAEKRFGKSPIVPYGRFLDIYYYKE